MRGQFGPSFCLGFYKCLKCKLYVVQKKNLKSLEAFTLSLFSVSLSLSLSLSRTRTHLVVVVIFVTHRHRVDDDKKTFETLPRDFL